MNRCIVSAVNHKQFQMLYGLNNILISQPSQFVQQMRSFGSQDNLANYLLRQGARVQLGELAKLNKKVKSIKSALKAAQKHNSQLHDRIKNMKENHQMELIQAHSQAQKYKQLYEMAMNNQDLTTTQLRDYRKLIKRAQGEGQKQFHELLLRQDIELAKLRQENRLLYQQIHEMNNKIRELQMHRRSATPTRSQHRDRTFFTSLKTAIQSKNQQTQKVFVQNHKLSALNSHLQNQLSQLTHKHNKTLAELQVQKRRGSEQRDRAEREKERVTSLERERRQAKDQYQKLIKISVDMQRDFERELVNLAKQLDRKLVHNI